MRLGFVTSVKLGLSCIEKIYDLGFKLEIAITLKDELAKKKSGRIYLDEFCLKHDLELVKIKNVNEQIVLNKIKEKELDWLFIIGWSQIAKSEILNAPKNAVIGMHPTLLPQGRGRASIPWAIIKGLKKTGVTAFKLDKGVDTGPIIAQKEIKISKNETATTLYEKVNDSHIVLIETILNNINSGNIKLIEQDDTKATEWPGRKPEDGKLNFEMSVEEVDRLVRATTHPYPGAFLIEGNKKKIIWAGRIAHEQNNVVANNNILKFKNGYYKILDYSVVELD